VVAHNAGATKVSQDFDHRIRLGTEVSHIAETDNVVDPGTPDIGEDRPERDPVRVDIRDQGDAHHREEANQQAAIGPTRLL